MPTGCWYTLASRVRVLYGISTPTTYTSAVTSSTTTTTTSTSTDTNATTTATTITTATCLLYHNQPMFNCPDFSICLLGTLLYSAASLM